MTQQSQDPETVTEALKETLDRRPPSDWATIGIFLILLVGALGYASAVLIPIVLATLLSLIFTPIRRGLNNWRIANEISAAVIVLFLLLSISAAANLLAEPVSNLIDRAPELGRELEDKLQDARGSARAILEATEHVEDIATAVDTTDTPEVVIRGPGFFPTLASFAPSILAQASFTLVLLFFLLASGDMFLEKMVSVIPRLENKKRAVALARDIQQKLSKYLGTISLINVLLGLVVTLVMWALEMPNPLLFGVMATILNFVPYLGAIVGTVISLVVGLVTFDSLGAGATPGLAYFILTLIEGQLITPAMVGRRLELNTVVVFVAVAFWAWLWSVMGMLMAVPLLIAMRTVCEHIDSMAPVSAFLSARGTEGRQVSQQQAASDGTR